MLRSAASKALGLWRATALPVVLAVMLMVVFGTTPASAHGGYKGVLHLGHSKAVAKVTTLVGKVATGSALVVSNPSGGSALELQVGNANVDPNTVAPMKVNSNARVDNLNADKLDGQEASDFYAQGSKASDSDKLDGQDSGAFQNRVSGACPTGQSIRVVNADGTVACEQDDDLSGDPASGDLSGFYPNPQIAGGAVSGGSGGKILDGTINQADIAPSGVGSSEVANGSLRVADIAATSFTKVVDFGSISAGGCMALWFTNSTVVNGDLPILIPPTNLMDGLVANSAPVASGWTYLRICNVSNAALDPASLTFTFVMLRP